MCVHECEGGRTNLGCVIVYRTKSPSLVTVSTACLLNVGLH